MEGQFLINQPVKVKVPLFRPTRSVVTQVLHLRANQIKFCFLRFLYILPDQRTPATFAPLTVRSPPIRAPDRRIAPEHLKPSRRKTLLPTWAPSRESALPFAVSFALEQSRVPSICAPCSRIAPEHPKPSRRKTPPPIWMPSNESV